MVKVVFKIKMGNITMESTTNTVKALELQRLYSGSRIVTSYEPVPEEVAMTATRKNLLDTYGFIATTSKTRDRINNRFADHSITPRFKKGSIV